MKRPTKKPQEYAKEAHYFVMFENYTPEQLRKIADQMEKDGASRVEFDMEGYDGYFVCKANYLESEEEASKRYAREKASYDKAQAKKAETREKRKKALEAEAEKYGFKLVEK